MEIIPNFPNVRVQNCRSIKEFKEILIAKFPGVLSNELNPELMKTEKPMHITHETAIHCLQLRETSKLMDIKEAIDKHYNAIVQSIKSYAIFMRLPGHHPARKLLNVCDQLSIEKLGETDVIMLDGRRIVVPKGTRRNIIKELHRAHSGTTKTFKTARQLYFWPNMKEELRKARRMPTLPG